MNPSNGSRVALITGAASGIGRSVVARFAGSGMSVVAVDVAAPDDDGGAAAQVLSVQGDVRSMDDMEAAVDAGVERFGRLDIVAAVAGILKLGKVTEMSHADRDAVLGVNLIGAWNTIAASLPAILRSPGPRRVLVCGSLASVVAAPGQAAYVASKHGLVGLVKAIALEHALEGVTANVISPASVATSMLDETKVPGNVATTPVGRVCTPDEVAAMFEFLASADAGYVTGENVVMDGGCKAVNVHSYAAKLSSAPGPSAGGS